MSQYLISTTSQMFAHHSCVIPFTKLQCFLILNKFRTLNSTVTVLEKTWKLNELIQAYKMFFMNFWYIEHYGASSGDDTKINYLMCIDYKQKI